MSSPTKRKGKKGKKKKSRHKWSSKKKESNNEIPLNKIKGGKGK